MPSRGPDLSADCPPATAADGIGAVLAAMRLQLRSLFERFRIAPADADDILQDSAIILLNQWNLVDNPGAYLLGTVRRRIFDFLRRRAAERLVQLAAEHLEQLVSERTLSLVEMRVDARRLVARLPPPAQQVVALRYGAGLRYREIAPLVGLTEAAVRQLLCRGLVRLRRQVGETRPPRTGADGGNL